MQGRKKIRRSISKFPDKELVFLGKVVKPRGLKGELIIQPYHPLLGDLREAYVEKDGFAKVRILNFREERGFFSIKIDGIKTREDAERLRGTRIAVRRMLLPPGMYYTRDIIGMQVMTQAGEKKGVVKDVISAGTYDIFVVSSPAGECLFPARKEWIKRMDMEKRVMEVVWPLGLEETVA